MNSTLENLKKYVRVTNYLSAAQIFLKGNVLLGRELTQDDIKPRLLGHWGTCPGINFVYAHLNRLIVQHDIDMLFVLGPGHGFPALQANLFVEGSLGKYYPEATLTLPGVEYITKNFSWPYGFPSHSNPGAPGVIVEGGELGYSLSTSYGAVLDNPDLIVSCLIGDGEAETGALATAWHLSKFINPATDGAVLPILHLNGYKISGPTIMGRMNDQDLENLFRGYGYEPYIVEGKEDEDENIVYQKMMDVLDECYAKIRSVQKDARDTLGKPRVDYPRFPMIVLRTPKGWTGIKTLKGEKLEGNFLSHQVIAKEAKTDAVDFDALKKWLESYQIQELFDHETGLASDLRSLIPAGDRRMGDSPHARGIKGTSHDLVVPDYHVFTEDASIPGTIGSSSMRRAGEYLKAIFDLNKDQKNFRLFSPDETYSNKLDKVFESTTRAFSGHIESWDKDLAPDGRVMEMLSEHSLQGMMQGYVLTGRHGVFASYEAFIQIVSSMADQYAKFLRIAREIPWRLSIPSFNYILTSSGWRQEHNGFSHQNPSFIDSMLQKEGCFVKVFFPPDGNSTLAVLRKCMASKNEINVIVAGKTLEPRWLTPELAEKSLEDGMMVWDFASDLDPDIVIAAAGDYMTKECMAAIEIVKTQAPEIRVRFVNVIEISALGIGNTECRVPQHVFEYYFTPDKPIIFNFHGYPDTMRQVLFEHQKGNRDISIHGYIEHGSTTTPFDLHMRNQTSRFDIAIDAFRNLEKQGVLEAHKAKALIQEYENKIKECQEYAKVHGVDQDAVENWVWKAKN